LRIDEPPRAFEHGYARHMTDGPFATEKPMEPPWAVTSIFMIRMASHSVELKAILLWLSQKQKLRDQDRADDSSQL